MATISENRTNNDMLRSVVVLQPLALVSVRSREDSLLLLFSEKSEHIAEISYHNEKAVTFQALCVTVRSDQYRAIMHGRSYHRLSCATSASRKEYVKSC